MKAAFLTKEGFEIQDVKVPDLGEGEVLVKTLASGICSGDVFVYKHRADLAGKHPFLGHEATGEIAALGPQVAGWKPGAIVASLSFPTHAEFFVAGQDQLVQVPSEIDPRYALGEPIACCVHASNRFGIRNGARVAVVGCGFMGLVCMQLAKVQGAGFILGIDPLEERRQMSMQMGADRAISPSERSPAQILEEHGKWDVVIEAVGVQAAVDLSTDLVTQHGRIILVGYHQSNKGMRTVNMQQWNYKAIDVVNGHVRRMDEKLEAMREGMELLRRGLLLTEPLVTLYPLEQAGQAFQDLSSRKQGLYKAVLVMDSKS